VRGTVATDSVDKAGPDSRLVQTRFYPQVILVVLRVAPKSEALERTNHLFLNSLMIQLYVQSSFARFRDFQHMLNKTCIQQA